MNKFRGWRTVFSFNYKQNTASKSYSVVTALVAVLIIAVCMLVSVLVAKPEKEGEEEQETCSVKTVYVLDQTGLGALDFEEGVPELSEPYYAEVAMLQVEGITEEELSAKAAIEEEPAIGVVVKREEDKIFITAIVPSTSDISVNEGQEFADLVAGAVEKARLQQMGINEFKVEQIKKQTMISVSKAGEQENVIVYLVQYIAPAIFGLVLYFLLLLYGQTINQSVSVEKTSKLIETLLTSLHPYALLMGKVLAVVTVALQQFLIWVAALFAGLIGGGYLAKALYPESESGIGVIVDFMRENIGESALSPVAAILALITFCCGFLFYCVLAGMAGSMVSRPEEAANTQSIFLFPIMISWITCYFATLMQNEGILVVARNIPFTVPFCVPVDLLTGAIGIGQGILSTVIVLVTSVLIIMLSGRIYKGLVLYTGEKLTWKSIIGILKNRN